MNKVNTNYGQDLGVENKIIAINNAQIKLLKRKVGINNNYGLGLDSFKKRYQDLQNLIVPYEKLKVEKGNTSHPHYKANLGDLGDKYFLPIGMYSVCSRDKCKDRVVYIQPPVKHEELLAQLKSPLTSPSFSYQETLATITSNEIEVYVGDPEGEFVVDELHVSYLRYPKEVDTTLYGGYEHHDGSLSTDVDSELEYYLKDELLDLVILDLSLSTQDQVTAQASQVRAQENE